MVPSPTAPVAVNVTGLPASPALVAVRVLAPTAGPNVQLPTVAMPLAFEVALKAVAEPPPEATAKVTLTPLTGLLLMSRTSTLGAIATAVPAIAGKVSGLPASRARVAVRVLAPTVAPSVQLPMVAMPLAFEVALRPVAEP